MFTVIPDVRTSRFLGCMIRPRADSGLSMAPPLGTVGSNRTRCGPATDPFASRFVLMVNFPSLTIPIDRWYGGVVDSIQMVNDPGTGSPEPAYTTSPSTGYFGGSDLQ